MKRLGDTEGGNHKSGVRDGGTEGGEEITSRFVSHSHYLINPNLKVRYNPPSSVETVW